MSSNDQGFKSFVPEKVIGVTSGQKAIVHDHPTEHPSPNFENAMMVVDDLQEHFGKPITKVQRSVLESIGRFNLKEQFASNLDIAGDLKERSYEHIRKITRQLDNKKGNGLIIRLLSKRGHEDQFVLANMQHIIKVKKVDDISHDTDHQ